MIRQGKYTKRVTAAKRVKRGAKRRFEWWRRMSWKKRALVIGVPILTVLVLIPLATYFYFAGDISDMNRLMNRNNTGIVLYDKSGKEVIYSSGKAEHRDIIPLSGISKEMQQAVIASEDKDFYKHDGFSILSTLRAVYGYVLNRGSSFGGSTITQQLAKITVLSSNRSFLRQYQAFSIAVAIENKYSKDEILAMYLNSVYFGENSFGIYDAAKTYFGTTPDKLTLAQSAMLVGVLPAPSVYSPVSGNAEYAKERQTTVLSRMVKQGNISEEQKQAALAEVLAYQPQQSPFNDSKAPHFAQMVLDQLYAKYGEETVTRSGYQVTTSLDATMQDQLEQAVAGNMSTIRRNGGSNAAAVAIDPKDGGVRALVGSYDWNDEKFGKVNVATTPRQPGSSFKPIYYTQALSDGTITPATVLEDKKTDFGGWTPQNADRRFRGNVTVRQALDWSLNIPAIEVMQKVGVSKAVETAQRMGITSVNPSANYGLALALGTAEAPLMQMTNAYAAYANQGVQYSPTVITSIKSKYDEGIFTAQNSGKQVVTPEASFLISNILADNGTRGAVFGNTLNVYDAKTRMVKKAAVKTGTTDDARDAWTIGYTPGLAVGVWVGNNDNSPMSNGGSIMAGPIWTKAMGTMLAGVQTDFATPPGVVQKNVCRAGGGIADKAAGNTYTEFFLSTSLPTARCNAQEEPKQETSTSTSTAPQALAVSLAASPGSSAQVGADVTFTATLSRNEAGRVAFKDGDTLLGTVQVANGSAALTTGALGEGEHTITATFIPADTSASQVDDSLTYEIKNGSSSGNGNGNRLRNIFR